MEIFIIIAIVGLAYLIVTSGTAGASTLGGLLGENLSYAALRQLAVNAGFSDPDTAAAIAMAESSGNPSAVGDISITPGGSIGLWQINLAAHPEYTADQLKDPQTNANAAYAIYAAAGNSFTPWTTYNTGAYQAYLQTAAPSNTVVAATASSDSEFVTGDTSDTGLEDIGYGG
jgi:hypothetical protein